MATVAANLLYCKGATLCNSRRYGRCISGTVIHLYSMSFLGWEVAQQLFLLLDQSQGGCACGHTSFTHTKEYLAVINISSISLRSHQKTNILSIELNILVGSGYCMIACEHMFNLHAWPARTDHPSKDRGWKSCGSLCPLKCTITDNYQIQREEHCSLTFTKDFNVFLSPLWQRSGTQPRKSAPKCASRLFSMCTSKQIPLENM